MHSKFFVLVLSATIALFPTIATANPSGLTQRLTQQAIQAEEKKEDLKAEKLWRQVIQSDGKNAIAYQHLGQLLSRKKGQKDAAIAAYQKAFALGDSSQPEFFRRLGIEMVNTNEAEYAMAAVPVFQKYVMLTPKSSESYAILSQLYFKLKRYDDIVSLNQAALKTTDDRSQAYAYTAIALGLKGEVNGAIVHYQKAIAEKPTEIAYYGNLRRLLSEHKRLQEMTSLYRNASTANPKSAKIQELFGDIFLELEQSASAIAAYQTAIALNPKSTRYVALSELLLKEKKFDQILALLKQHTTGAEASVAIYFDLADALRTETRLAELQPIAEFALSKAPQRAEWHFLSAVIYHHSNQWEPAAKAYRQAATIAAPDPTKMVELTINGKRVKASLKPTNIGVQLAATEALARVFTAQKQWANAAAAYREVMTIQPDQTKKVSLYHVKLGDALKFQQKWKDAIASYETALKLDDRVDALETKRKSHALAHFGLGEVWQQQGNWKAAIAAYEAALKIEPTFDAAQTNLQAVQQKLKAQ